MYNNPASSKNEMEWSQGLLILRFAAAMCFIGHGAFGIITKAAWVPYFGVAHIPSAWAWKLMPFVGTFDIALGVAALVWPRRWIWLWMAVWAVWTALLRPLSGVLRCGAAMLLCGHAMLALGGKAALVNHWHLFFPHMDALLMTRAAGAVEMTMAFFILLEPTATLCFTACAWKLATESLFFIAGAPVWEFVERGGSYGVPLVLGLYLARQHLHREQPAERRMQCA